MPIQIDNLNRKRSIFKPTHIATQNVGGRQCSVTTVLQFNIRSEPLQGEAFSCLEVISIQGCWESSCIQVQFVCNILFKILVDFIALVD